MLRRLTLVLATCAVALSAQEDEVRLKSGAVFKGRIVAETEAAVKLQFPGGAVDLRRELIAEVLRGRTDPARAADDAALSALDRLPDAEQWFFLYRDGVRIGWRHVKRVREIRDGTPGYVRVDRRVFTGRAGGAPEVDLAVTEFVDAALKPRASARRLSSGATARLTEGAWDATGLTLVERAGGRETVRRAPFPDDGELPGLLFDRLAREPRRSVAPEAYRTFDPAASTFADVSVSRALRRVTLRGQVLDVHVFRRVASGVATEAWYDLNGRLVREELDASGLAAVRAASEAVGRFASGEDAGADDLGLVVEADLAGLRFVKPDPGWETAAGDAARSLVLTALKVGRRATVDVFELAVEPGTSAEALCLDLMARLEAAAERPSVEPPARARYGATEGVAFAMNARRRGEALRTLGFLALRDGRALLFLCAAPKAGFADVEREFVKLLESVEIEAPPAPKTGASTPGAEVDAALR
ncbi:MAG TPA: hypothetical protein VEI02_08710 [Planctomycetota bacterium]|nr:hypothetical protein [Planctomycetota bacterium]